MDKFEKLEEDAEKTLILPPILASLFLLLLLPVGIFFGVESAPFSLLFILHLASLCACVLYSFDFLARLLASTTRWGVVGLGVVSLFIVLMAFQASHPIIAKDALIHHLAVPKMWAERGRICAIHWHEWSNYPMLLQLAYTGFLVRGLESLTPYYHLLYLILFSAAEGYLILWKTKSREAAALGAVFAITLPIDINLASTPLVDLGCAYFCLLAIVGLLKWAETESATFLLVSGISLGLALGTKYNALLFAVLFGLFLIIYCLRVKFSIAKIFKAGCLLALIALITFSPWLIKNYAWTGNPIFPLYNGWFSGAPKVAFTSLTPIEHRLLVYHESWLEIVAAPFRFFFLGQDGSPRYFDGVLSPFLVLSFLPVARRRAPAWVWYLFLLTYSYFLFALVETSWRVRYLAPIFGPLLVLTSLGALTMGDCLPKLKGKFIPIVGSVQVLLSLWYGVTLLRRDETIPYLGGAFTKSEYLERHLVEYPMVEFVNERLPASAGIYLLYTSNEFYYYDRRVFSGGYHSEKDLVEWLRSAKNSQELAVQFKSRGLNYLLVNRPLALKGLESIFTNDEKILWNDFQSEYLEEVYTRGDYTLWKIKVFPILA